MNIVAVSAEPEFVKWEDDEAGSATLTFEIARFNVTEAHDLSKGSLQVHLLPADIEVLVTALAAREMTQHSLNVSGARYEWKVQFRNDRMGFTKTKQVEAHTNLEATSLAFFELTSDGYKNADFSVIECTRGREVNT